MSVEVEREWRVSMGALYETGVQIRGEGWVGRKSRSGGRRSNEGV